MSNIFINFSLIRYGIRLDQLKVIITCSGLSGIVANQHAHSYVRNPVCSLFVRHLQNMKQMWTLLITQTHFVHPGVVQALAVA